MGEKIGLRLVRPFDEPFLFSLFRAVRAPRFDFVPPGHPQMASSIHLQFKAREQALAGKYPGSDDRLIVVEGTPAGRFRVARDETSLQVADLTILPDRQRNGIGTGVMKDLIAAAQQAGLPIRAVVAQPDLASFRFFRGLGFEVAGQNVSYVYLERRPSAV
jgi:ribosomal protein S18 acetylase RimI-like enzyme